MNGFDLRWVSEPEDPEVAEWLGEIDLAPDETAACPQGKHTAVPVQAADQMAMIDTGMAEVVFHLFRLGIEVEEACEHTYTSDEDGDDDAERGVLAALQFGHLDDMQTLVTLIARENPEDGSFYAHMTGDYFDRDEVGSWFWHIKVSTIGRKPVLQPILTFPVADLEEFTVRLAAAAL